MRVLEISCVRLRAKRRITEVRENDPLILGAS